MFIEKGSIQSIEFLFFVYPEAVVYSNLDKFLIHCLVMKAQIN